MRLGVGLFSPCSSELKVNDKHLPFVLVSKMIDYSEGSLLVEFSKSMNVFKTQAGASV
jgi:hypothetical protein